jgi:hypothetical protein
VRRFLIPADLAERAEPRWKGVDVVEPTADDPLRVDID